MSEYIKAEELEDACRMYGVSYERITEMAKPVTRDDIVKDMSALDIRTALEEKEQVFATQIWTKEDIISALAAKKIEPDDELVDEIMKEAKSSLEDCSDNWMRLHEVITDILNRRKGE